MRFYYFCILLFLLQSALPLSSQPLHRYLQPVFENVVIKKNISYAPTASKVKKEHLMDIYLPDNDTCTNRPLIIWMHGGGFKFGKKTSRGIPIWCRDFARRGYVCVAINYKKTSKNTLTNFNKLVMACHNSILSLNEATACIKQQHTKWGVDTNRIILAGNSAGAMMALQSVFSSPRELEALAGVDTTGAQTAATYNPFRIKAIVNFWGGIYNTSWLAHATVPIVSVHGLKDKIVPYKVEKAPIYGSYAIHAKADSLNLPNALKTYPYSHELQRNFNPFWAGKKSKLRWAEAGNFAADFLYHQVITK